MGCSYNYEVKYNGPHIDLHTESSNSLFGLYAVNETPVLMEEDAFGRVLYFYKVGSSIARDEIYGDGSIFAFLIMQKSNDEYVYYYSDINFIVRKRPETIPYSVGGAALLEEVLKTIPNEEVEELKAKNDWGKPIDESKCIKVKLARINRHYTEEYAGRHLVPQSIMQEVYDKMCINGSPNIGVFFRYLTSDDYDRHIYFFRTSDKDWKLTNSYVVMFKLDGSYEIAEIVDLWNYQEELIAFKEGNNWNKPIE